MFTVRNCGVDSLRSLDKVRLRLGILLDKIPVPNQGRELNSQILRTALSGHFQARALLFTYWLDGSLAVPCKEELLEKVAHFSDSLSLSLLLVRPRRRRSNVCGRTRMIGTIIEIEMLIKKIDYEKCFKLEKRSLMIESLIKALPKNFEAKKWRRSDALRW